MCYLSVYGIPGTILDAEYISNVAVIVPAHMELHYQLRLREE